MSNAVRDTKRRTQKVSAKALPISPPDGASGAVVSPILYEPIFISSVPAQLRLTASQTTEKRDDDRRVIQSDGRTGYISVLSHRLPEPTSYTGKNLIALDFGSNIFSERPGQARLLHFDGKTTYVDCKNPPQLQARSGNSLTIEAWVRADNVEGAQHIVTHGQTRDGGKGAEVFLRIWDGLFEFGTWDGAKVVGVCGGAALLEDEAGNTENVGMLERAPGESEWIYQLRLIQMRQMWGFPVPKPAPPAPGVNRLTVRNEDIGVWVHLAAVYDHVAKTYSLYRNGSLLASAKGEIAPLPVKANWFIGAMKDEEPTIKRMDRFFKGRIAEVRIWTVARTAKQIVANMWTSTPPASPGQVAANWRLTDGDRDEASDSSGSGCHGAVKGEANWNWSPSPIGELDRLARRHDDAKVKATFEAAQKTGIFDAQVFPRVRSVLTQMERQQAKDALKNLDLDTFKGFYDAGYHLILRRAFSGATEYAFVPNPPPTVEPQLMLVEEYRLSSFLGSYGVGRTLKSFSLLPGERTKLTVKTSSKTDTTAKQSQSILDSYSQESASEFENSLSDEKSNRSTSSEEMSYHASVEASGSWGFGSCSAEAGAAGSSNSAREEFAKSVSSATAKHAARASANRNVQIDTTTETKKTDEQQTEIVRDIENINVGRTLNFVFCQMNQEFVTLLHLIDVRIGYTNGIDPAREVPLYELPELLDRVLLDDAKQREAVHQRIIEELRSVRDYRGSVAQDFILPAKGSEKCSRYSVNRDFTSTFGEAEKREVTVPGIVVSAKNIVMRTEDVVVDAVTGEGSALDSYAEKLQSEENRSKSLANDRVALENKRLQLENKGNALLMDLVRDKETELLKLYIQARLPVPADSAPQRVVSIWERNGKP
ncbi:MAG: LamG domain-containing protein [Terriglobia bacterium]